jgi:hypothetical protein
MLCHAHFQEVASCFSVGILAARVASFKPETRTHTAVPTAELQRTRPGVPEHCDDLSSTFDSGRRRSSEGAKVVNEARAARDAAETKMEKAEKAALREKGWREKANEEGKMQTPSLPS